MANTEKKQNGTDALAFIIGGLFIAGLVFATYNYFTNAGRMHQNRNGETALDLDSLKETLSTATKKEEAGEAKDADKREDTVATEDTQKEDNDVVRNATWKARDHEMGDVEKGATYTVQAGDTLWEIAEGAYGNGALWTKILEANKASIGFLPNGQQALIQVGQTLVIPTL